MECFWREKWRENDGGKDEFGFGVIKMSKRVF